MNRKKLSVRLLLALTLLVLIVPATMAPAIGQSDKDVAILDPLQGLVQHHAADAPPDTWETLTRPTFVAEGDSIRTDHLGMAELVFFEGNLVEILPNTQVKIAKFDMADDDSPVITIEQSVGDMRTQIDNVLDADSRYEVDTPSAVITVRGTNFWSLSNFLSESNVHVLDGITEIAGVSPEGLLSQPVFGGINQSVFVPSIGQPGTPTTLDPLTLPKYPPSAPLAPATCGNLTCEPGEEQLCALDCQTFPACGNGVCEQNLLESPVTCARDCVPAMRRATDPTAGVVPTATSIPQPCVVRTIRADVPVRVGPGFNRGARDFLRSNTDIPVIGKFTDPEGNLWWKIQPPGFIPAEADRYWVLSDDVDEFGDCAAVPDSAASQIVAPQPPRPTAGPTPTRVPGATAGPTLPPVSIEFYADTYVVYIYLSPKCANIYWDVEGIKEVYFEGDGVTGHDSAQVCPRMDTTYELMVVLVDGSVTYRYVTITVSYSD
jgi:hypothetical protein